MAHTAKNKQKNIRPKYTEPDIRVPRPQGLTYLCHQQNKETNPVSKQLLTKNIKNLILTNYLNNNFQLCNKTYNIQQLATYLNINEIELIKEINRRLSVQGRELNNDALEGFARDSLFRAFFGLRQVASKAQSQTDILALAQGSEYKPFLTEQVNKAIANEADILNKIATTAKAILPAKPAVQIINNNNQAVVANNYIGPDEAFRIIEQKTQNIPLNGAYHQQLLLTEIDPKNLPDIVANAAGEEAFMATKLRRQADKEAGDLGNKDLRDLRDNDWVEDPNIGNEDLNIPTESDT